VREERGKVRGSDVVCKGERRKRRRKRETVWPLEREALHRRHEGKKKRITDIGILA
jgi:hypothetical protein